MLLLPADMGAIIKFNVLTGLRPNEAIAAIRLLRASDPKREYYNESRQCLEHFRFPEVFLRRTKSAYVSIITEEQLSGIGVLGCKTHSYVAIQYRLARSGIDCHLGYCRKIFGSWLRQSGIAAETVDLLQGRVPRSVFARHYFTPSLDFKTKVLDALQELRNQLES
jgi:intergrase/recombinase